MPSIQTSADRAAGHKYSATPGQVGSSVIEGHVDSARGPAVFFRLGALHPGNTIEVTLADGVTAVFRVTGVREYAKSRFPARAIYGATDFAALRLITCGGAFDDATGHYLSSTVVYASLASSRPGTGHRDRLEQGQLPLDVRVVLPEVTPPRQVVEVGPGQPVLGGGPRAARASVCTGEG